MSFPRPTGRSRYRVINGHSSIELKLRTPRQLFDERDPAPFKERDLNDDAARYILQSYREIEDQKDAELHLHFETLEELQDRPQIIAEAIHSFFHYEKRIKARELKETLQTGLVSLVIGLTFLFTCTLLYHGVVKLNGLHPILQLMIKEGSMIMGYVSMWKPLSTMLYEWWPILAQLRQLEKLSAIDIDIINSFGQKLWSSHPDFEGPQSETPKAS